MSECPNCKNQLQDGAKFCNYCGTPIAEMIYCPYCGQPTNAQMANCQNCGALLVQQAPVEPDATTVLDQSQYEQMQYQQGYEQQGYEQQGYEQQGYEQQPVAVAEDAPASFAQAEFTQEAAPKEKKPVPKKAIIIGVAAAAVVALVVILCVVFGGKSKVPNYALYIKDKQIFYSDFSKKPVQVTSDFVSSNLIDNGDLSRIGEGLGYMAKLAKDGKTLFYLDKLGYDGEEGALYYRNIKKPKQEPVKIDSSIDDLYYVSDDVSVVTFISSDGVLYQYSMKKDEKNKIASDVDQFYVSNDGKTIVYLTDDDKLYCKANGKDAETVDSDIDSVQFVSKNRETVYYVKEGTLYSKTAGKDKVKISQDVSNVISVYESGEVYYTKKNTDEIKLSDYVEDDMKAADEAFVMPEYPSYPSWWDYDTNEAYEKAYAEYEKKYDAYTAAYDEKYAVDNRNRIREGLETRTMENNSYTLYFYNGSEEKVVSSTYSTYDNYATDAPVMVFKAYSQSEVTKVKISEISSSYEVENLVNEALYSSSDVYVASKETASVIEAEEPTSVIISNDGTTVYFLDNVNEDSDSGDLYKVAISGGKASKPEMYDSDVYYYSIYVFENGDVLYYKDYDRSDHNGTMYINKNKIADDADVASAYSYFGYEKLGKLMFVTDYSSKSKQGVLNVYENGKVTKIADDVHDATLLPNGNIIYLSNYSTSSYKGDLYLSKGSKAEKLDEDVVAIYKLIDYGF